MSDADLDAAIEELDGVDDGELGRVLDIRIGQLTSRRPGESLPVLPTFEARLIAESFRIHPVRGKGMAP